MTLDSKTFSNFAENLADWARDRIVTRHDTYPEWKNGQRPHWCRVPRPLTRGKLVEHFIGSTTIGAYSIDPDSKTVKYIGWDVDCHAEAPTPQDIVNNTNLVMGICEDLRNLGFAPVVEDSNGKGGYHIWLLLASPLPYDKAHSFGRWAAADETIEVFPKQKRIGDYGNQLRLPGQHHKEDHWSKIWDWNGKRWAEGDDAAQLLLSAPTADPDKIPQEAFSYVPPTKLPDSSRRGNGEADADWLNRYCGNLRTLDIVRLCDDCLTGGVSGEAFVIQCPWHDQHTTGDDAAYVWEADGERFPTFFCNHSHCSDRTLADLLACYSPEDVDACCTETFDDPTKIVELGRQAEQIVGGGLQSQEARDSEPGMNDSEADTADQNEKFRQYTDAGDQPPSFTRLLTSRDLLALDLRHEFLIENVLVRGQPCIVGGKSKTLKTNVVVDAVVSLGTGLPFLGRFPTTKVPVAMWTGESGATTIRESAVRIARAKGVEFRDVDAFWNFELPKLSRREHLEWLRRTIETNGIQVAVIDPLYLALLSPETANSASNLYAMGAALEPLTRLGQDTGCTIILIHHYKKSGADDSANPCQLEDLAQSGAAEWCRQWLLLQRRLPYIDNGVHDLWLRAGGSAGHGATWAITVEEGLLDSDTMTRDKWEITFYSKGEMWERAAQEKDQKRKQESDRKEGEYRDRITTALKSRPETINQLKIQTGINPNNLTRLLRVMVRDGVIEEAKIQKHNGEFDGYRLIAVGDTNNTNKANKI